MKQPKSQILLLTHGNWGESLIKSLNMILGTVDNVQAIALNPVDTSNDFFIKVELHVQTMPKGSLIITDLFGGTTSNVALRLCRDYDIGVITGLSAPLLLEAINLSDSSIPLIQHISTLVEIGRGCCKDAISEINILSRGSHHG